MRLSRVSAHDGYFSFVAQQGGRPGGDGTHGTIDGPLMLQYLLAMLQGPGAGGGRGMDLFEGLMPGGAGGGGESGRWGDYVFSQEGTRSLQFDECIRVGSQ